MRKLPHCLGFAAAFWSVSAVVLTPYVQAAHECVIYHAFGQDIPVSEYHHLVLGEEDIGLVDGTLTGAAYEARLTELLSESEGISYATFQAVLGEVASELEAGIGPPMLPDGTPSPPPMKLPLGPEGQPNPWRPVDGTPSRPVKWTPTHPVPNPGGGQPGSSWDPKHGHWDVDNGLGHRVRQAPDGTPVNHGNEPICPPPPPPEPFTDYNYDVILLGAAVVVAVVIIVIAAPAIGAEAAGIALAGVALS